MILPITSTAKLVIPTPSFKIRLTMILSEKATIQITIYAEFLAHYQNSVFNPIKDDEDKKLFSSSRSCSHRVLCTIMALSLK